MPTKIRCKFKLRWSRNFLVLQGELFTTVKTKCVSAEIAAICKMRDDRVSSSPQSKSRAEADLYTLSPDRLRQGLIPAPSVRIGGFGLPVVASKKFDQCVALQAIAPSFVSRRAESFPCVIPTGVREVEGPRLSAARANGTHLP